MPNLVTNRYGVKTPTVIQENGCAISTPFYINGTPDQTKQLLNAFRVVKQKQLLEIGYDTTTTTPSGLVIETAKAPPLTPIEQELGLNEEGLRQILFSRQGVSERLILKLQRLTGVYVVTREQIEDTFTQWLNHLYGDEQSVTSQASTTTLTKKAKVQNKTEATV
jgi:hypothetical protein